MTIPPTGAYSQDGPTPELGECIDGVGCLITREAAKQCQREAVDRRKVQRFDELAAECRKTDESLSDCETRLNVALGKRDECRDQRAKSNQRAEIWQARALQYEAELESKWSPWTWIGVGAGSALVTVTVLRLVLGPL